MIEGIQAHVRARGLSHDPSAMTLEQLHALNFHRRAQRLAAGGDLAAALHELAPLIDGHAKLRASYALTETLILATDVAFRLGEEATARRHLASAYAHDPSNLTVNTLFSLRPSTRAIVNGALANQLGISDDDTSRLLEALALRVDAGAPVATKARLDWKGLLRRLGARPRAGASPSAIAGLEQRLAVTLPDSYRAFLAASDGAPAIQRGSPHLLRASEVRWFAEENQGWIDVWTAGRDSPSDQEYLVYGTGQDPTNLRVEYLKTALQISSVEEGSVFLLNPKIRTDDGEWEAWYLDVKLPGAQRYTSFHELIEALRREE